MTTLTRYIFKEMLGPTALGFGFYTSILLMKQFFDLAEMIIKQSLAATTVLQLLMLSLPHLVVLTVPMSLLFGILIAVGRLSSDSEIIAMRALGISTRTIYRPVFLFSFLMFLLNLYLINVVMPQGNRRFTALANEILTSQVEKEIRPRIFYDEFENLMIYVNDLDPRTGQWRGVFVADSRSDDAGAVTPAEINAEAETRRGAAQVGSLGGTSGQRVIVAGTGSLALTKATKQVWMNLGSAETHLFDPRDPERYDRVRNASQRILLPSRFGADMSAGSYARSLREMNLRELIGQARTQRQRDRQTYNLARVEIHKKFAIPFACLVFGVLGLPLGITNRRGGKSSGFSLSIGIILFYYVMINNGEHLAATGKVPPALGMWGANLILLAVGIYLLIRANRDAGAQREGGLLSRIWAAARRPFRRRKPQAADGAPAAAPAAERSILNRLDIDFPNLLDRYVLREFLKILGLVLVSVMALFIIVDYTEIARDVRENSVPFHTLAAYYRFLVFQVLNWTLPISVLVATLVTFGMFSKNNEVTAFKSGGVSLYRIALPIVAVAAVISVFAYFILDFVLPYSNQRVAALKRRIEGKTPIASGNQQKLWLFGKGRYMMNFLSYDPAAKRLNQVQVFEFHPTDFRLTRRVSAQYARWNGSAWEFNNGWMRSFTEDGGWTFSPVTQPLALYYSERPEDFATESRDPEQMTFRQLRRYIETVRRSGYAAEEQAVKLYTKTSWPVISLVMALIALPFAFRIGKRGALYGVGIALVLGILYWMVFAIFTKFGEVGNLPPLLAAWSANILFAIAAVYLFLNVET